MKKSLYGRCIRRWKVEMRNVCDSKISPHWRKRDLRGFIRETAIITADSMIERLAESNAQFDFTGRGSGWSPEFAFWYRNNREKYLKEARDHLNEEATSDEIAEEIRNELEAWND